MKTFSPNQDGCSQFRLDAISSSDDAISVVVKGVEYDVAKEYSSKMWSNSKRGEWGVGLANSVRDPFRVERVGLLGEIAFAKIFGLSVDLTYRPSGDDQDFKLFNCLSVNVKTSTRNYGCGLVKVRSETGIDIPLRQDIYVFGYVDFDFPAFKTSRIVLVGCASRGKLENCPLTPALKGHHVNRRIEYGELTSMVEFKEMVKFAEDRLMSKN